MSENNSAPGKTIAVATILLSVLCGCEKSDKTDDVSHALTNAVKTRYIAPYKAGNTDEWLRVFSDDAVALHDGLPPLEGKEAIRWFADTVAENFEIRRLDVSVDEVRRRGDWAWTRGRFDALFVAKSEKAPPGVEGERQGKYLLLWERQTDGQWSVVLDMGNGLDAPPPQAE